METFQEDGLQHAAEMTAAATSTNSETIVAPIHNTEVSRKELLLVK